MNRIVTSEITNGERRPSIGGDEPWQRGLFGFFIWHPPREGEDETVDRDSPRRSRANWDEPDLGPQVRGAPACAWMNRACCRSGL